MKSKFYFKKNFSLDIKHRISVTEIFFSPIINFFNMIQLQVRFKDVDSANIQKLCVNDTGQDKP